MAQFVFPSDLSDTSPFVMFTPFKWTTVRKSALRPQSIKEVDSDVIVMHPPSSGIVDSVSHSWDEEEGFMDVSGMATHKVAQTARQQIGSMSNQVRGDTFFNDFMTLAYNGSTFREFTFSWESLVPKSREEAEAIARIIAHFGWHSSADYRSNKTMEFPSAWTINAYTPGMEIMRWENSVVTAFNVNYQPDSVINYFNSGHVVNTNLEISFKQILKPQKLDYRR